ncbi:unnamed protein product, partial [Choristocarpus tenellus]
PPAGLLRSTYTRHVSQLVVLGHLVCGDGGTSMAWGDRERDHRHNSRDRGNQRARGNGDWGPKSRSRERWEERRERRDRDWDGRGGMRRDDQGWKGRERRPTPERRNGRNDHDSDYSNPRSPQFSRRDDRREDRRHRYNDYSGNGRAVDGRRGNNRHRREDSRSPVDERREKKSPHRSWSRGGDMVHPRQHRRERPGTHSYDGKGRSQSRSNSGSRRKDHSWSRGGHEKVIRPPQARDRSDSGDLRGRWRSYSRSPAGYTKRNQSGGTRHLSNEGPTSMSADRDEGGAASRTSREGYLRDANGQNGHIRARKGDGSGRDLEGGRRRENSITRGGSFRKGSSDGNSSPQQHVMVSETREQRKEADDDEGVNAAISAAKSASEMDERAADLTTCGEDMEVTSLPNRKVEVDAHDDEAAPVEVYKVPNPAAMSQGKHRRETSIDKGLSVHSKTKSDPEVVASVGGKKIKGKVVGQTSSGRVQREERSVVGVENRSVGEDGNTSEREDYDMEMDEASLTPSVKQGTSDEYFKNEEIMVHPKKRKAKRELEEGKHAPAVVPKKKKKVKEGKHSESALLSIPTLPRSSDEEREAVEEARALKKAKAKKLKLEAKRKEAVRLALVDAEAKARRKKTKLRQHRVVSKDSESK